MDATVDTKAVTALESLYSGPMKARELARAREIFAFLRRTGQGAALRDVPLVNGKILDLVGLLEAVTSRGGVRRVQDAGGALWGEVMNELGLAGDWHAVPELSMHYKNLLFGYEQAHFPPGSSTGHLQQQQQRRPQQEAGQPVVREQQVGAPPQRYTQHDQYQLQMRQRELEKQQQQQQQQQMNQQQGRHQQNMPEQQRVMARQQQQHQQRQQQYSRHQPSYQAPPRQYHPQQQHQQNHPSGVHGDGYQHRGGGSAYPSHHNSRSRFPQHRGGAGVPESAVPRADLPEALGSSSFRRVCEAVNTLTLETYGTGDEELLLEEVPGLLDAIFDLMDKLNPAVAQVRLMASKLCSRIPKDASSTPALLDAAFACLDREEGKHSWGGGGEWGRTADDGLSLSDSFANLGMPPSGRGEILLLLLNALRNASFVPSNERLIGHSARTVQHFVSFCSAVDPDPEVFAAFLRLFGRVAKHLDISGRRAAEMEDEGCKWAEDSLNYLAPAHVRMGSRPPPKSQGTSSSSSPSASSIPPPPRMSPSALEYVSSLVLIFPTLVSLVSEEERSRVLSSLAILGALAQMDSNREAFDRVPTSFLERLTELLSIPMLGCDILAPDPASASSQEWLEANCRVLPPSIAGVDGEVRETALEVMSYLAGLSDNLRSRLGTTADCIRTLTQLAITVPSGPQGDHQARRMAGQTLTSLASCGTNHARIRRFQAEVVGAAARDAYMADLLFNGLRAVFPAPP